jgi:hypothetical protein
MTSFCLIGLSWVTFLAYFYGFFEKRKLAGALLLLVIVAAEPVEIYTYLANMTSADYETNDFSRFPLSFPFVRAGQSRYFLEKRDYLKKHGQMQGFVGSQFFSGKLYYTSKYYLALSNRVDGDILYEYGRFRFVVYDRVERMDDSALDPEKIQWTLLDNKNVAFIPQNSPSSEYENNSNPAAIEALRIEGNSDNFQLLNRDINHVKFKTHFDAPKFLVFNDCFHSSWRARINGIPTRIWRANVAFQGVWLPAGENIVEMRFGEPALYLFNWALWGLFHFVCFLIFWEWRRSRKEGKE